MLQTNLIGRKFQGNLERKEYTCVAVYVQGGNLWLVGETDKGSLVTLTWGQVSLITTPRAEPENLMGVI